MKLWTGQIGWRTRKSVSVISTRTHFLKDSKSSHSRRIAALHPVSKDSHARKALLDVLTNLAEDGEAHPARAIAEEVVALLNSLQRANPPASATEDELAEHVPEREGAGDEEHGEMRQHAHSDRYCSTERSPAFL